MIEYRVSNEELLVCIDRTNNLISQCPPDAERFSVLNLHFQRLLKIQEIRAGLIGTENPLDPETEG